MKHRELSSVLCADLEGDGGRPKKKGNTHTYS